VGGGKWVGGGGWGVYPNWTMVEMTIGSLLEKKPNHKRCSQGKSGGRIGLVPELRSRPFHRDAAKAGGVEPEGKDKFRDEESPIKKNTRGTRQPQRSV